jgi:hypothetical protein
MLMLHCTRCGVTQEAVGELAVEYAAAVVAKYPEKSDRALAAAIGVSSTPSERRGRQLRKIAHLKSAPAGTARAVRPKNPSFVSSSR